MPVGDVAVLMTLLAHRHGHRSSVWPPLPSHLHPSPDTPAVVHWSSRVVLVCCAFAVEGATSACQWSLCKQPESVPRWRNSQPLPQPQPSLYPPHPPPHRCPASRDRSSPRRGLLGAAEPEALEGLEGALYWEVHNGKLNTASAVGIGNLCRGSCLCLHAPWQASQSSVVSKEQSCLGACTF